MPIVQFMKLHRFFLFPQYLCDVGQKAFERGERMWEAGLCQLSALLLPPPAYMLQSGLIWVLLSLAELQCPMDPHLLA